MDLTLVWRGPMVAGNFPGDVDAGLKLSTHGIYVRLKLYKSDRLVAYVGQLKNLLSRFEQHVTGVLSLVQQLRGDKGNSIKFSGDGDIRANTINNLKILGPIALSEAKRLRFIYALAEGGFDPNYLTLLESFLKHSADHNLKERMENVQSINPSEFDHEIKIYQNFSLLKEKTRLLVRQIIGPDPILIPAAKETLDCV